VDEAGGDGGRINHNRNHTTWNLVGNLLLLLAGWLLRRYSTDGVQGQKGGLSLWKYLWHPPAEVGSSTVMSIQCPRTTGAVWLPG
jgi:hypothetical protein